jgi:hypothetical protein
LRALATTTRHRLIKDVSILVKADQSLLPIPFTSLVCRSDTSGGDRRAIDG